MFNIFLLKTLCQLSLFFFFVQLLADMMQLRLNHFGTIVVYFAALWVSFCLRNRHLILRLAPLALIGILVPAATPGDWLFVLVPFTAFSAYIIMTKRYTIDHDGFRDVARLGACFLAIMGLLSAFSAGTGAEYILIALVCGIILSRDLRHDISTINDPTYKAISLGLVLIILGGASLANLGAMRRFVVSVLRGVQWLYLSLINRLPETIDMDFLLNPPDFAGPGYEEEIYLGDDFTEDLAPPGWLLAFGATQAFVAMIIICCIIGMGVWIARKLFSAHGDQSDAGDIIRERLPNVVSRGQRGFEKQQGYSGVVRRYYKRFMRLIIKSGANLQPRHTSYDIRSISHDFLGDDGNDLREVYIRARYSTETITQQDTRTARDALRRIKSGKEK